MSFDSQVFLDAQITQVSEKRPPLPTENPADGNGLYTATIGEPTTKTGEIKNGDRAGQTWVSLNVPLKVQVPQQLQEAMKLQPELTITHAVFLDFTADGQLDLAPGRNRGLRDYREALGMNSKGEPFSPRMMIGRPVRVQISHEMYNDAPQERIKAVLPLR